MVTKEENQKFLDFLEDRFCKDSHSQLENELITFLISDSDISLQVCRDISKYGLSGGTWLCYTSQTIELIKRNFKEFFIYLEEINEEYEIKLKFNDFFKMFCLVYEKINFNLLSEYENIENIE